MCLSLCNDVITLLQLKKILSVDFSSKFLFLKKCEKLFSVEIEIENFLHLYKTNKSSGETEKFHFPFTFILIMKKTGSFRLKFCRRSKEISNFFAQKLSLLEDSLLTAEKTGI